MKRVKLTILLAMVVSIAGCKQTKQKTMEDYGKGTFGYDVNYLSEKDQIIILKSNDESAQVVVSPGYQAKVFTSTVGGMEGKSLGYLKYEALDSEVIDEHMNGYGGENRLWLGPEGGKYSIYFKPGAEQIYDNWHTPAPIDTEPWEVISSSDKEVSMKKSMQLLNYIGTTLQVDVNRSVRIMEPEQITSALGIRVGKGVRSVGYLTENSLTNKDDFEWTPETGTICVWMLDMYHPAPNAVTIIPFHEGNDAELGRIATTDYFGEIPADRLKTGNGVLYLKTDGKMRNKLGMNAFRTKAVGGNYDPDSGLLTVTTFDVNKNSTYLNQEWNPAKNPLIGDVLNAYNDGPLEDGSIMGPFLELESASPAAFLKPGETFMHRHNVFHFVGDENELTLITEKIFGVSIEVIKNIFK